MCYDRQELDSWGKRLAVGSPNEGLVYTVQPFLEMRCVANEIHVSPLRPWYFFFMADLWEWGWEFDCSNSSNYHEKGQLLVILDIRIFMNWMEWIVGWVNKVYLEGPLSGAATCLGIDTSGVQHSIGTPKKRGQIQRNPHFGQKHGRLQTQKPHLSALWTVKIRSPSQTGCLALLAGCRTATEGSEAGFSFEKRLHDLHKPNKHGIKWI